MRVVGVKYLQSHDVVHTLIRRGFTKNILYKREESSRRENIRGSQYAILRKKKRSENERKKGFAREAIKSMGVGGSEKMRV